MITIVDYGIGNLGSIANILKKIGAHVCIAQTSPALEKATKFILPGVGSFDEGIRKLHGSGLLPLLTSRVLQEKVPLLGICLGMQLLTKTSQEGTLQGLGWIDAQTVRFHSDNGNKQLKIPHMGWNQVIPDKDNPLFRGMGTGPKFYFVHSYHVLCNTKEDIVAQTRYGYEFTSVFRHENIWGVQFHPEKSHSFGMKLLKNFITLP
ncbi:MAG TPA: imidazole glycerol phosphate synthase subunit HisH [Candidatus Omnitrophota bacterium]|nr:imidazole glycerol phosphate synthase subunit HisH [Candidatus Omnitrophota bacterium]